MNRNEETVRMAKEIEEQIETDFSLEEREAVKNLLSKLNLTHVMAQSEWNLLNARKSILILAQGKLKEIPKLLKAAQTDFRDVIYWVWQNNNPKPNR